MVIPGTAPTLERVMTILGRTAPSLRTVDERFDIVDSGAVDSAGFMELFRQLEDEFGIVVTPTDLDFDNFRTPRRIADFVVSKMDGRESTRAV